LDIVPDGTNKAASLPRRFAPNFCNSTNKDYT
jgi:hypothetical protein